METLKFTTLTLLIPLGWIMSEAAAAYPEPIQQIDTSGDRDPNSRCLGIRVTPEMFSLPKATEHGRPEPVVIQEMPAETAMHPQDRGSHAGTCRLDLNLIEID